MGARDCNSYVDCGPRIGVDAAAERIQDLFLAGCKTEAAAVQGELTGAA